MLIDKYANSIQHHSNMLYNNPVSGAICDNLFYAIE